jgi:hypothetical protein
MTRFGNFLPLAVAALVGAATLTPSTPAHAALSVGFSSTPGSEIVFNQADPGPGLTGSFSFQDVGGVSFEIDTGTAMGLMGHITGTYNIGTITTVVIPGPTPDIEFAAVTAGAGPTHTFEIYDGANTFSADVAWIDIFTQGTGGQLNAGGSINLTNISYGGSNADLQTLATTSTGFATITFQFINPTRTLTSLTTDGGATTFSGTLSPQVVPEPGAIAMLASAVPAFLVVRSIRRRKNRGDKAV